MILRLRESPTTTASELRVHLRERFGVDVSRQLVSLVLTKRLGYSWKRTRKRGPRGAGWGDEQVDEFKRRCVQAFREGRLSSWDESSFDLRCRPVYGYAPLGHRAIVTVGKTKCKHSHFSLLMGMHMNGSVHHTLRNQSTTGIHFAEFVDAAPFPAGTVVLLDNHPIHKTRPVRMAAYRKGYTFLHPPPYTPEFNPIELAFGVIKNKFYQRRYSDNFGDDMRAVVDECVHAGATPSTVLGCFNHVACILDGTKRR